MAKIKGKSFAGQIQLLIETQPDFPQRFKQRLVFESSKVANPIKFIGGLISKGVLCDGSDDLEANFGLKEMMVQLAEMLACSKGAEGIGGLMEALEESGNSALISALRTWAKEDFGIETDSDLSEPNKVNVQTAEKEMLAKHAKNAAASSGSKLIDKIMSHEEKDLMEKLEAHLLGMISVIFNPEEFYASLVQQNILHETDMNLKTESGPQARQWTEKAIKVACSKRAIGSLVVAFQCSGSEQILDDTLNWLETTQEKTRNYPIAVKSLALQRLKQESKTASFTFFQQAIPSSGLHNVATFNSQPDSSCKGTCALDFDSERIIAHFTDGTVKIWNLRENKETTIKFGIQVKNITCFEYDEEILVVGTAEGTVHLFDIRTLEEKWLVRLGDGVLSLKLVESTLVILTRRDGDDSVWWVDISRSDMQLVNRREALRSSRRSGFLIDGDYTFLYHSKYCMGIHSTKSGEATRSTLKISELVTTLIVSDLITTKRTIIGGCENGWIQIWGTFRNNGQQSPRRSFAGHEKAIVSMCVLKGHLLSLDETGKLLMWSGHDLESDYGRPIPRVLAENFYNVTSLVAHDRWLASCSSQDGIISIWTVPDLWLRTG